MNVLIIEHAAHESAGIILDWLKEKNYEFKIRRPFAGDTLNSETDFDFLVIMGGPQSAYETDIYPYLSDEINFVKEAIKNNKQILGVCLGAQIISEALGNKVARSIFREYGFYPVEFTDYALAVKAFEGFPKTINCLHWHNEMPGITENLILLGKSEGCPVQGVIYNENIIGLQFHMEIRRNDVEGLIEFDKAVLSEKDKFIMTPQEIREHDFELMNSYMKKFLDNFVG